MTTDMHAIGAAVVRLSDFRREPGPGTCPVDAAEKIWTDLRRGRLMPDRTDLDPKTLLPILEHVTILERISRGHVRFRVVGTHLSDLAGAPLRALPLSAVFESTSRPLLTDVVSSVLEEPAVVRLSISTAGRNGIGDIRGRMILLPLRSDLRDVSRILAAVSLPGAVGPAPHFLRIDDVDHHTLVGFGSSDEKDRPGGRPRVASRSDAPCTGHGHLRLVSSTD